jgi:hypothetical protein
MASSPPPCQRMGPHCRSLRVLLRITSTEATPIGGDHEATWLLGHTERLSFGVPWEDSGDLYSDSVVHVPCRHFHEKEDGSASCAAHGFRGRAPRRQRRPDQPRQLGGNRFRIVERSRQVVRELPMAPAPARSLPVVDSVNPCQTAACETSDHTRKAACCRDLQIEIMCTTRERKLEALVRSRKSPYLCKVKRDGKFSLDAELISACGYLGADGVACSLHGRVRADGRPAKPELCSDWPPKREEIHPGCVFAARKRRR